MKSKEYMSLKKMTEYINKVLTYMELEKILEDNN